MLFCFVIVTILMLFMNNNIKTITVVNFSYWVVLFGIELAAL